MEKILIVMESSYFNQILFQFLLCFFSLSYCKTYFIKTFYRKRNCKIPMIIVIKKLYLMQYATNIKYLYFAFCLDNLHSVLDLWLCSGSGLWKDLIRIRNMKRSDPDPFYEKIGSGSGLWKDLIRIRFMIGSDPDPVYEKIGSGSGFWKDQFMQ